jgi:hypothetical protein
VQAVLEIRQLKQEIIESNDEISLLHGHIASLTRENEKLKKEKHIMETSGAKSMDASVLAEVQLQLVEAHSRVLVTQLVQFFPQTDYVSNVQNSENTQLIQTLDQAVAARDQSIMRAVTKMKEMACFGFLLISYFCRTP